MDLKVVVYFYFTSFAVLALLFISRTDYLPLALTKALVISTVLVMLILSERWNNLSTQSLPDALIILLYDLTLFVLGIWIGNFLIQIYTKS